MEPPESREPAPSDAVVPAGPSEDRSLVALLDRELIVPVRSSGGEERGRLPDGGFRHGSDESGPFLAAFTDEGAFEALGPPGSDRIRLSGRDLFERAERASERVVIDPGGPNEVEIPTGVLPFLVAGMDLARPDALRARRPLGALPPLEAPSTIPEPFGSQVRAALAEIPAVERAWLLRAGPAWTAGVELHPSAPLSAFDEVRNRLHVLAAEHLGARRGLIVTDLRGATLRAHYAAAAAPFYEPPSQRGFLSRLIGRDR